jgi:asparagine synthase (glutamine-hydrolysing)
VQRTTVAQMLELLRHRGPDAQAVRAWPHVAFGHSRLSIVDLNDAANQPFADNTNRYWITFNGEIYNFIELRDTLVSLGHTFRTRCDTEVILEAYKRWGPQCLRRFNGMWAFAIYDSLTGECFLARDRFGVKPLHHTTHQGQLLFASEIKALLRAGADAAPNYPMLGRYFARATTDHDDQTVFAHIRSLAPGHWMRVRDGQVETQRYWATEEQHVELPRRFKDRAAMLRELLTDAVRLRLRNDVPTALTVSGGMDSSAIHAAAAHLRDRHAVVDAAGAKDKLIRLFSVAQPGHASDESPYTRACLQRFGDEATWIEPKPHQFAQLLERAIWHQEAPVWGPAVLGFHAVYDEIAQAGIRVVLEGFGSDEMFGGYPHMIHRALDGFVGNRQWRSAWQAARCLSHICSPALEQKAVPAWRWLAEQSPRARQLLRDFDYYLRRLRLKAPLPPHTAGQRDYLNPDLLAAGAADLDHARHCPGETPLQRELYSAFHHWILPTQLRVMDHAAMAASLESRSPFLDYRIVQFAFSLPASDLVGRGESKHILREAFRKILPRKVVQRKQKMGFTIDAPHWFNSPSVQSNLRELFHGSDFSQLPWVNSRSFNRYFDTCCDHGFRWQDASRVWEVANTFLWWRSFVHHHASSAVPQAA